MIRNPAHKQRIQTIADYVKKVQEVEKPSLFTPKDNALIEAWRESKYYNNDSPHPMFVIAFNAGWNGRKVMDYRDAYKGGGY